MPDTPRTVLVIHLAGIGDLLNGLPTLKALREGLVSSRIVLLTWRKSLRIAELIPTLDERLALEPGWTLRAMAHNWRTIRQLRRMHFDLAINLYQVYRRVGALKLCGLLRMIRPKRTAGRDTDGKGFCFDVKCPERFSDALHEVERQLAVVERVGYPGTGGEASLRLSPEDEQAVEQWLTDRGVKPDEMLIGIHPGGGRLAHHVPWQTVVSAARALELRYRARVILTGWGDERRTAEQIAGSLDRALVAGAEFPLGRLACLWRRCRLVIANDSGPMHLAATLRVPLVAVVGPGVPERHGPYPLDRIEQVILYPEGCPPCFRYRCAGHEAWSRLPPDAILAAAETILRGGHPRGIHRVPRRTRVLHVHTLPLISGSGINTALSMRGQQEAGYAVELACAPPRAEEGYFRRTDVRHNSGQTLVDAVHQDGMVFRPIRHFRRSLHPWHDLCALIELWRLMRRERYHVVHTHNSKAGIIGRLAAKLAGVPVVVHTYHSCVFRYRHLRTWQQRLFLWAERAAAPLTDHFIAISEPLRQEFIQAGIAPHDHISVAYSGIELERFQRLASREECRRALGWPLWETIIGSVARLDVGKGHGELFRAMAQLAPRFPHLKLVCVGDGPLRGALEAQRQRLGLAERIILLGERHDLPELTQAFDIAVLASHYEGMGRVLVEAQAAGKPVVATRAGGIPDIVKDEQTGYLVPVGDVEALARALARLAADEPLRLRMGRAAAAWAGEQFSSQRMCAQLNALYEQLLKDLPLC